MEVENIIRGCIVGVVVLFRVRVTILFLLTVVVVLVEEEEAEEVVMVSKYIRRLLSLPATVSLSSWLLLFLDNDNYRNLISSSRVMPGENFILCIRTNSRISVSGFDSNVSLDNKNWLFSLLSLLLLSLLSSENVEERRIE